MTLPRWRLTLADISGVRLATFNSIVVDAFQNVEEFHLDDCLLKPDQVGKERFCLVPY